MDIGLPAIPGLGGAANLPVTRWDLASQLVGVRDAPSAHRHESCAERGTQRARSFWRNVARRAHGHGLREVGGLEPPASGNLWGQSTSLVRWRVADCQRATTAVSTGGVVTRYSHTGIAGLTEITRVSLSPAAPSTRMAHSVVWSVPTESREPSRLNSQAVYTDAFFWYMVTAGNGTFFLKSCNSALPEIVKAAS